MSGDERLAVLTEGLFDDHHAKTAHGVIRYGTREVVAVVDSSQARVHAKMRSVMGMGSSDESQRLAMQLLRRAQASKGIFSINALFKEFVLTEPLALARWDVALEAYREASRLFEVFDGAAPYRDSGPASRDRREVPRRQSARDDEGREHRRRAVSESIH